jgi:glutathione S-transferase
MSDASFRPVIYLKAKCPFCMKVRIFLLESGLLGKVEVKDFAPGTDQETAIRAELEPKLEKVSFPAAQTAPGQYMTDSDGIIGHFAKAAGADPATMPVLSAYVEGPFQQIMTLFRENMELKKAASA